MIPTHLIQIPTAKILPILATTIQRLLSKSLVLLLPVEPGQRYPKMHPEYNKHTDVQMSASGQKEVEGFLEKDLIKVDSPGIVIKLEDITSSI